MGEKLGSELYTLSTEKVLLLRANRFQSRAAYYIVSAESHCAAIVFRNVKRATPNPSQKSEDISLSPSFWQPHLSVPEHCGDGLSVRAKPECPSAEHLLLRLMF